MALYRDRILPYLIHISMRQKTLMPYRQRVISRAKGRVLEIGVGSGPNLPFYGNKVASVVALDPSPKLLALAHRAAAKAASSVEFLQGSAETIPLADKSFDTVVTSWTLCTIPDVQRALGEVRRVLNPDGRLLFVEHGLSPDTGVRKWQDWLTPAWKRIGGGCHLNRPIVALIEGAGFRIERLETGYMKGPKPMTFMYEGSATPR